eukprot:TRINITY_DN17930_c0_g1_i3.p1 TRINITY_DN17930_c0_g1~~TRINITY_DN17930_c0_g1_i3.p1  ORF type:complete len:206 (+),score=45.70 TRINITY_DN17930_c0_g1_i3:140-757(+)
MCIRDRCRSAWTTEVALELRRVNALKRAVARWYGSETQRALFSIKDGFKLHLDELERKARGVRLMRQVIGRISGSRAQVWVATCRNAWATEVALEVRRTNALKRAVARWQSSEAQRALLDAKQNFQQHLVELERKARGVRLMRQVVGRLQGSQAQLWVAAFRQAWTTAKDVDRRRDNAFTVSYTHLRAHETPEHLVCRLLLEKKK